MSTRVETPLLIAFADIDRFVVGTRTLSDVELAGFLSTFYELVAKTCVPAGRIVKFMGDAALIVFDEDHVDDGVSALLDLRTRVDAWLADERPGCHLVVKAHYGRAVAGPYGVRGEERFDVIGHAVNTAATLVTRDLAISDTAFRKLSPETRKRFKKHTPPVTYIPLDGKRP